MFNIDDRVRYIDEQLDKVYGVLTIIEIKNGFAICEYGGYEVGITTENVNNLRLDI